MRVLSERSKKSLDKVHPKLVQVVKHALQISEVDFTVVEGVRSIDKQKEYVAKGASKTMRSKHLLQDDGYGHAVDLYPFYGGSVQVNANWQEFQEIARAMKSAAQAAGVTVVWGGDWKTFKDGPHFQLEVAK